MLQDRDCLLCLRPDQPCMPRTARTPLTHTHIDAQAPRHERIQPHQAAHATAPGSPAQRIT